jgi:hypothetical protein
MLPRTVPLAAMIAVSIGRHGYDPIIAISLPDPLAGAARVARRRAENVWELHGAYVSPATRNPRWHMEIP